MLYIIESCLKSIVTNNTSNFIAMYSNMTMALYNNYGSITRGSILRYYATKRLRRSFEAYGLWVWDNCFEITAGQWTNFFATTRSGLKNFKWKISIINKFLVLSRNSLVQAKCHRNWAKNDWAIAKTSYAHIILNLDINLLDINVSLLSNIE